MNHRRIEGRLVIATHNPGKLAEMRDRCARLSSLDRYLPVAVRPAYQRGLDWLVAPAPSH